MWLAESFYENQVLINPTEGRCKSRHIEKFIAN